MIFNLLLAVDAYDRATETWKGHSWSYALRAESRKTALNKALHVVEQSPWFRIWGAAPHTDVEGSAKIVEAW